MDTLTIVVHPIPPIDAGRDTTIMAGSNAYLLAQGGSAYQTFQWYPENSLSCNICPNPTAFPMTTTTYLVKTVDEWGCYNLDTVTVYVEDCLTLYVPNAFTPTPRDPANNIFYAYGACIYKFEFYIFNRWGEKVFETNNQYVGWNGMFKGSPVQEDVYVWLAKAQSVTGITISKTGTVTVLK
jgi:gliding motility-associated-like protein